MESAQILQGIQKGSTEVIKPESMKTILETARRITHESGTHQKENENDKTHKEAVENGSQEVQYESLNDPQSDSQDSFSTAPTSQVQ